MGREMSIKSEDKLQNLIFAAIAEGNIEGAFLGYEQIIAANSSPVDVSDAFASMITLNLFRHPFDESRQQRILKSYSERFESQVVLEPRIRKRQGLIQKPLKVGFISGDFRNHPVSFFLESTFKQLENDPKLTNQLALFAYYNYSMQDDSRHGITFIVGVMMS
jgi:predicted O-linked N-acetylglucosamine transferase (SPINDLY family)